MKKQRVSFVDGALIVEYPTIGKKFSAEIAQYPAEIREAAMIHGFKQKFGDAASGGSPAEKFEEVQAIHASLLSGEWERTAAPDLTPLIIEAVASIQGIKVDKVRKVIEAAPEKAKEWGQNLKVKAWIAAKRAKDAAARAEEAEDISIDLK